MMNIELSLMCSDIHLYDTVVFNTEFNTSVVFNTELKECYYLCLTSNDIFNHLFYTLFLVC